MKTSTIKLKKTKKNIKTEKALESMKRNKLETQNHIKIQSEKKSVKFNSIMCMACIQWTDERVYNVKCLTTTLSL